MIDLVDKNKCICLDYNSIPKECVNRYTISEKGKSVKLQTKNSDEDVCVIILDQCMITDNNTKCDAIFLYKKGNSKKISFLVELKGAGDIEKAFEQLSYTKLNRLEYKNIIEKFVEINNTKLEEKFVVVSNGMISKSDHEKLEKAYNIRIKTILYSEAISPIPDLKELI